MTTYELATGKLLGGILPTLVPGDTLLLRGGTYPEAITNNIPAGLSWAVPTTVKAYPGEPVTLKPPTGTNYAVLLQGVVKHHIVLEDLVIDAANCQYDALRLETCNHIRTRNVETKNAPWQGVLVTDAPDCELIKHKSHHNGGPVGNNNLRHGFYISSHRCLMDGCAAWANACFGIQYYRSGGGMDDGVLKNSESYGNGKGMVVGSGARHQVYGTRIWGNLLEGAELGYGNASDLLFAFNTLYKNGPDGLSTVQGGVRFTIRNNISFGHTRDYTNQAVTFEDHNLFGVDPLFVNPASGDFHLLSGSWAVRAGVAIPGILTDPDGMARAVVPSIGAYELVGQAVKPVRLNLRTGDPWQVWNETAIVAEGIA